MNGHVLYTPDDFKHLSPEELDSSYTYDLVVSGGLNICKVCGDYEAGLDKPCRIREGK